METCVISYSSLGKSEKRHTNELHRRLSRCPATSLSDLIPVATAALKESSSSFDVQEDTPFARALAKVRVQIQTRRLKEKYLGHEWIRLALGLPVDESFINDPKHYLSNNRQKKIQLNGRTGEIATWYEWRFNKKAFSMDEIESKVDRLRKMKLQHRQ